MSQALSTTNSQSRGSNDRTSSAVTPWPSLALASPELLANPLDVLVELGYLGRRRRGDVTEFVVNPQWKGG